MGGVGTGVDSFRYMSGRATLGWSGGKSKITVIAIRWFKGRVLGLQRGDLAPRSHLPVSGDIFDDLN